MANAAIFNNVFSGNNWNEAGCWEDEFGMALGDVPAGGDDIYLNNASVYVPAGIGVSLYCGNIYPGGHGTILGYNSYVSPEGVGTLVWQATQDLFADWIRGSTNIANATVLVYESMNLACNVIYGPRAVEIESGEVYLTALGNIFGSNSVSSAGYAVVKTGSSGNLSIINTPLLEAQPPDSQSSNYSGTVVRVEGGGNFTIGNNQSWTQIVGGKVGETAVTAVEIIAAADVSIYGNLAPSSNGYASGNNNVGSSCVYLQSAANFYLHGEVRGSNNTSNYVGLYHANGGSVGNVYLGEPGDPLTIIAGTQAPAIAYMDMPTTCYINGNLITESSQPAAYLEYNSTTGAIYFNTANSVSNCAQYTTPAPALHVHSQGSYCSALIIDQLPSANFAVLTAAQWDDSPALNKIVSGNNHVGAAVLMTANTGGGTAIVASNTILVDQPYVPAIFHCGLHQFYHNPEPNHNTNVKMAYRAQGPGGSMHWWTPGNYVLPDANNVQTSVSFGADGVVAGNLTLPANNRVESGVQFGPAGGYTGTLEVEGGGGSPPGLVQDLVL